MNQHKSVSVIIPNYNKELYLEKCVSSIIAQTYLVDEIIIVDDCSMDNSRNIITRLSQKYECIVPVLLDKNGGVSNARNEGVRRAKSDYITFIDSDDYYFDNNKIKKEMALIDKYGDNTIAYSAIVRVDCDNHIEKKNSLKRYNHLVGKITFDLINRINTESIPRDYCMSKKIFLTAGGYSYPKNFFEDLDLLMRLSQVGYFRYTGGYGTAYRITPGGLSARSSEEQNNEVNKIICTYYSQLSLLQKCKCHIARYVKKILLKACRCLGGEK